jgi:hypothetical protein
MTLSYYELDYEEDRRKHEIFITEEDPSRFTVTLKPEVTCPGFLTLALHPDFGGKVVGQIDATFDFSKMPPHRHADALNWILQLRTLIRLRLWDGR